MTARTTRIERRFAAPPQRVYAALLDARAVQAWKVPDGMRSEVHTFEPHAGGAFRVSLTYEAPGPQGKTSAHTDTYAGRFVELVPGERVVEALAFETADPAMAGTMRITYALRAANGGTDLVATHEDVPPGIRLEDNAQGWSMALARLADWLAAQEA